MSDSDDARSFVQAAFLITDREWPGLCDSWKQVVGLDLSDDPNARMEYFLAVLAAAQGQNPRSGLRTMIHDAVRRLDPDLGVSLYRSLRRYEHAWENWRTFPARLPLPPLEFPQEALGIAFLDGADLSSRAETTVEGTYHLAVVQVVGTLILVAAVEVRRMCEASRQKV